jgi:hypothetical protein
MNSLTPTVPDRVRAIIAEQLDVIDRAERQMDNLRDDVQVRGIEAFKRIEKRDKDRICLLFNALQRVPRIAAEAAAEWDADHDARVGKILIALSGRLRGYRSDIDEIHSALSPLVEPVPFACPDCGGDPAAFCCEARATCRDFKSPEPPFMDAGFECVVCGKTQAVHA